MRNEVAFATGFVFEGNWFSKSPAQCVSSAANNDAPGQYSLHPVLGALSLCDE